MRFGSTIIFVVAFLCAGIAAWLVRPLLIGGAPARSSEAKIAAAPMVSILVAARDLRPGDRITADMVRQAAYPADSIPKGALTSTASLFREGEQRIAALAVAENEPLVEGRLEALPDGLSGRLHEGMRGITIRVNEASSVAGFVQPEDRVDVLLTQTDRQGEAAGGIARAYTKTLVKNVRVLAADQQTQRRQQTQPPKTVTLEVSEEDAKKLTLASAIGQLSLTLNKGENNQDAGRVVNSRDIAGLVDERRDAPAAAAEDAPVVAVFRSTEKKIYRVPQQ